MNHFAIRDGKLGWNISSNWSITLGEEPIWYTINNPFLSLNIASDTER